MAPNVEKPGETISAMSANSLVTQEGKLNKTTLQMLSGLGTVNLSLNGAMASYERKDMAKILEDLLPLWGIVKNDPPAYREIERTFIAANADESGHLLKCRLKKYRGSGSSGAYMSVFNSVMNFLDSQRAETNPSANGTWGRS